MKKLFNCEIHYFQSPHLAQIYDGFEKLRKLGVVNITYKRIDAHENDPRLKVILDGKHHLIYDLLDGFNWSSGSIEEKLEFFKKNTKADYYFKRSFKSNLINYAPLGCKVFPLGLNYPMSVEGKYKLLKELVLSSSLFKQIKPNHKSYPSELFEAKPNLNKIDKIIFYARLWNPIEVKNENSKLEREKINENRIDIIRACKKEFGNMFQGGIIKTPYSETQCDDIIAPKNSTHKLNYLAAVKSSNICISTSGLHDSIGWQMGEYVAASKAIVSMSLNYELPGNFIEGKNYLRYTNIDELLNQINFLLKNKDVQFEIMRQNFEYYNSYLKPDVLVLNTLKKINNDLN